MSYKTIPFNQLGKAGYNRPINRSRVNKIKRDFHPDMVQPAIVSFRDGKYWIIDHQHQSQAIYELNGNDPNTPIKCDVRVGLTYQEEAELYSRLNTGSKPLSFADKLVGLIEAEDPDALAFRDTVEACGYVVGGRAANSLRALQSAWKVFSKKDGKEALTEILTLTYACWPNDINGADSRIIEGISEFLKCHRSEYQRERFVNALSPVNPKEIVRKATTFYKQMDSKAFTRAYCTYTELVKSYNMGLRNKLTQVPPAQ